MPRIIMMCVLSCAVIFLQSCSKITNQCTSEIDNGPFKVIVRSQEFNNSGSQIVDICVANTSSHEFPDKSMQCFLKGYDFDGLSVKWRGPTVIEVSFRAGRVTHFTNAAMAFPGGSVPEAFHILLCDGCDTGSKDTHAGELKR
jgi:hypothetical protein